MAGDSGSAGRHRLRVLIVEDEFLIADYLSLLLEDAGHEIAGIAGTARQALQMLASGTEADVATLDVRLPGGMDGTELAAALRQTHGLPFLFITGSGEPEMRRRCEAQNPLAILQKPINPALLAAVLARVPARF